MRQQPVTKKRRERRADHLQSLLFFLSSIKHTTGRVRKLIPGEKTETRAIKRSVRTIFQMSGAREPTAAFQAPEMDEKTREEKTQQSEGKKQG